MSNQLPNGFILIQSSELESLKEIKSDLAEIKTKLVGNQPYVNQDFISISEAEKRYDISKNSWYNHAQDGLINLYKFGRKTFLKVSEIEDGMKRESP